METYCLSIPSIKKTAQDYLKPCLGETDFFEKAIFDFYILVIIFGFNMAKNCVTQNVSS